MATMEISQQFSNSNDQIIIKRKRTKRPRPSSSTSPSGVCLFSGGGCRGEELLNSISISSPSSNCTGLSTTTEEEDRDIAANCLIFLARGGSPQQEEIKSPENKTSSRKFTEMPLTTNGKVGIYVYECKTCSRTFPSFQALGGHRASHKKPKPTVDTTSWKKSPPENQANVDCGRISSEITVTLPNRIGHHENEAAKIHECSVCGSEFGSGQALGGHMRRHRSAVSTNNNLKNISQTSWHEASEKAADMLALDLNMPALPEYDRLEKTFPKLPTTAVVDCHHQKQIS